MSQVPGRRVHPAAGSARQQQAHSPVGQVWVRGRGHSGRCGGKTTARCHLPPSPSQHPEAAGSTGETEAWPGGGAGLSLARRGKLRLPGLDSEHLSPVTSHLPTSLANSPGVAPKLVQTPLSTLLVAGPGAVKQAKCLAGTPPCTWRGARGHLYKKSSLPPIPPATGLGSHVEKRKSGQVPGYFPGKPQPSPTGLT